MLKRMWWPMAGILAILLAAGPASAVTVTFDFNGGLGQNFHFNQVNTADVALDTSDGELRIYSGGMSGWGVRGGDVVSNFTIHGNFDLNVDFSIKTPFLDSQQLEVHPYGMSTFYVIRDNVGGDNYHVYTGSFQGYTDTSDMSGNLRIRRVGGTAYGYFWNSVTGDYQLIFSGGVDTNDINLSLMVQNNNGRSDAFNAAFDNLTITADRIDNLVPVPPAILLAGSGLLGLAIFGGRRRC